MEAIYKRYGKIPKEEENEEEKEDKKEDKKEDYAEKDTDTNIDVADYTEQNFLKKVNTITFILVFKF